ncbi:hypothetical protein [Vibrio parahaemolyticus]|uniref:hypothetical protein n=1 Tax=Vibrio parahaemolyticus TaxID=670 RepID=UPI0006A659F4|nr:hypothetical protein ACX13_16380 [Vibrio parahaemolyticus]
MNKTVKENLRCAKSLIDESEGYIECGNACSKILNSYMHRNNVVKKNNTYSMKKSITGYLGSTAMTYGMGIETVIKAFIILNQVENSVINVPKNHNLIKLFSQIDRESKKKINKKFKNSKTLKEINAKNKKTLSELAIKNTQSDERKAIEMLFKEYSLPIDVLEDSKDIFIKLRYFHEKNRQNKSVRPDYINELHGILRDVAIEKYKKLELSYSIDDN